MSYFYNLHHYFTSFIIRFPINYVKNWWIATYLGKRTEQSKWLFDIPWVNAWGLLKLFLFRFQKVIFILCKAHIWEYIEGWINIRNNSKINDEHLKLIDIESTTWVKSLFRRIGFCKCAATTSKPEIPEVTKQEAKILLIAPNDKFSWEMRCYTFSDHAFWSNFT